MNRLIALPAVAAGVLMLAGCGKQADQPSAAAAGPAAGGDTVFEVMNASIIPASNRIWELAGDLYDDDGRLDARRLTDAQWQQVGDAARTMGEGAGKLAATTAIKAAPAGVKIQGEGTPGAFGAAQVQQAIDADVPGFVEHAGKLSAIADEIAAAATAHDAEKADATQGRLTDVCGDCHKKFWYPNQGQ